MSYLLVYRIKQRNGKFINKVFRYNGLNKKQLIIYARQDMAKFKNITSYAIAKLDRVTRKTR